MLKGISLFLILSLCFLPSSFAEERFVQGVATVANGSADATLIAAPPTGAQIRVKDAFCSVVVAAAGGGGELVLENGLNGAKIFRVDADAVGGYSLNLGEAGYLLSSATLLNLTTEGAVTTQATGTCIVSGEIVS